MTPSTTWHIYLGGNLDANVDQRSSWLADPPDWRRAPDEVLPLELSAPEFPLGGADESRARRFVFDMPAALDAVNISLLLRRPLLVTGPAGIGKSSLAYSMALRLGLGRPLRWEINSRTTLLDGLYTYDAVSHLRDANKGGGRPIAEFVTLGPLGTALLPTPLPRVLLIDEIDKSGYDLPNDLLHVFEEGSFSIPELRREAGDHHARTWDGEEPVPIPNGRVRTYHHPVVVITSNGERDFPDAFLRRCVPLVLAAPDEKEIARAVKAWFPDAESLDGALAAAKGQPTDVVLNVLFAAARFAVPGNATAGILRRNTTK